MRDRWSAALRRIRLVRGVLYGVPLKVAVLPDASGAPSADSIGVFYAASLSLETLPLEQMEFAYLRSRLNNSLRYYVTGRAKTGQRGALKTGRCFDDAYTSSLRFRATFS